MPYRSQQLGIDSGQPRQCPRIVAIIFALCSWYRSIAPFVRAPRALRVPTQVNSRLTQGECVPVSIAMRLRGIFANVCFSASGAVGSFCSRMTWPPSSKSRSRTTSDRLGLEPIVSLCLFGKIMFPFTRTSASLFHCRSPFCASSASYIGSVSHPATETGLLIPSGKPGGLNGSTQHQIRTHLVLKTKAKIARSG